MAFRPLLPGILSSVPEEAVGGAEITMGSFDTSSFYISSQAAIDYGVSAAGSATGDLTADGGTIEVLGDSFGDAQVNIRNGNASATTINIDGTNYSLAFFSANNGYDVYLFSFNFQIGNTYTVVVT